LTTESTVSQHRGVSRPSPLDPADAVRQPVARALDSLIVGAAASFALSVAAVLTAVATPDGPLHEAAHFALVGVMGTILVARGIHILRRERLSDPDPWHRARAVHRSDAHLAQILTVAVPVAWLGGGLTIIVHHIGVLHGPGLVIGVWLPVAAAVWVLASFAWHDFCRDRIAAALDESDRKYREYWRDVADPG
jgi:hypothetical protein